MQIISAESLPETYQAHAEWFTSHIPLFECPDPAIQAIYYFRWDVYRQHIKHTPTGYVVTEFLPEVSWSGIHNTLVCATGHHIYEGRWLHEPRYLDDYIRFWFTTPDVSPRTYSTWIADAIYARTLATGDLTLPLALLDALVENYIHWEHERQDESGLFWQLDDRDGMEFQISGSGYRPTINSYQYGDAIAIATLAQHAGDEQLAHVFWEKATQLKQLVQTHLWDPEASFFKTVPMANALKRQQLHYLDKALPPRQRLGKHADVRELLGYIPWYFRLPDPGFESAWQELGDDEGFAAPYGPSTAERRHPFWQAGPKEQQHDCLWRGSSWPFATSQTLVALANLLRNYTQPYVSKHDYYALLQKYTRSQWLTLADGSKIPWIDESLHPDTGEWVTRAALLKRGDQLIERGRAYNHSTYADHIITGLIGLQPRIDDVLLIDPLLPVETWKYFSLENVPYHGHLLTILFDNDGSHYQQGTGLRLYVDDREIASRATLGSLETTLP